ncbi:haloacid dehalogenase-like hydrolase domain-containing protein At4g39970 [Phoenix dactylifera]|uniref:Haloacid dehalogenase-like hydrolase domain-containing protein At4g39970 n=1 Tax=Phoenix dactylifera TaxID=42345 RepID=A0A8B8JC08_PHODC|nr:haloacid dehalogenase-like hydrolase domain-containing protein At4g39970 [Phoenix dactylifera]
MRWYFTENGWPSSSISETPPSTESDKERLIDILQDWKTERYKEIIKSGTVEPRPGVLQLMDDAKCAGVRLAVCSAATKSSVVLCLENLIGIERFESLDCFLAGALPYQDSPHLAVVGHDPFFLDATHTIQEIQFDKSKYSQWQTWLSTCDDVKAKKPDPSIYLTAAKKLGVVGKNCLVVEDSVIGLQAATGAGMPCLITYTPSTAKQDFEDAIATYPDLSNVRLQDLKLLLESAMVAN